MTTPATTPTTTPATGSATRLRNGELRAMVARVLADDPTTGMTPRVVATKLGGRSSGAVGNALKVLTDCGAAEVVSTAPLTYRATATTAVVAATAITPAPVSTRRLRRTKSPATATVPESAAPAPTPTTTAVVTGPVTRPNGLTYHPRLLSGMPDVTALQRLREAGVAALLYGPPGTGKTSVVEAAFPDLLTVQGDGDTTVADFVGEYTQTDDGRYVFVHGPLVRAMRAGVPLFIDDATLIPPTVLAVVYPAMDGRRQIVVKANGGEVVDAADGFYVVAGHNPGVHGAILTDALSSRFSAQIHVSTDYDLAAQLKIDKRAVKVARNLATRQTKGEIGWAPQLRELIAFQKIAGVLGPEAAAGNLVGIAPEEDRSTVAAAVRDAFGTTVQPLALGTRI
ncbi:dynein-related subfamily AAA family protein [Lentzea atacamensis]|uniref:Dynein-related subfamily AAA family protein n=1 Tax=Lentzea atacamensis TaxID=531938 RepID=A0ABX9DY91_9PSEU|nr:AAA family ATPase [Lentzea atacamensis]RAS58978.1 dynein-related subfamily AAA family protein [Lentzea atacamensis]